ncbi:MAG: anaerobic ribonucleoside-triphosphate reductase activating protein [Clostridia bacterium]
MRIAGFVKNSFVDFRGKVASAVFTPFCNLDCYYCHNSWLIHGNDKEPPLSTADILDFLSGRRGLIEGVVVSGGEPLLQEGLGDFLASVKEMGFLTKLDTNGTRPEEMERLLQAKTLDYVAMDIKAPFPRYEEITGSPVRTADIKKSIKILMDSPVETEFRTTVVPVFTLEDMEEMACAIRGAGYYVLQQFHKPEGKDRLNDMRNHLKPHGGEFFEKAREVCLRHVRTVDIRGL